MGETRRILRRPADAVHLRMLLAMDGPISNLRYLHICLINGEQKHFQLLMFLKSSACLLYTKHFTYILVKRLYFSVCSAREQNFVKPSDAHGGDLFGFGVEK